MRRTGKILLILAFLFLGTTLAGARTLYRFQATVTIPPQQQAHLVEVWIPLPLEDQFQQVRGLNVSSPFPFEVEREGEYGNTFLHILHRGPIKKQETITIEALVTRKEVSPQKWTRRVPLRYLLSDRMIPLSYFQSMADKVTKDKRGDVAKLKAIYDFVLSRMKYDKTGKGWGRGDARWACKSCRGNCTDFHSLFIALARCSGIPSLFQMGLPVPPGGGTIKGYHCWVLAFPQGEVYGIDASEAYKHPSKRSYFFGHLDEDRIALTQGRDILLSPPQHGDRLNFIYKAYMEVDLKPSRAIKTVYRVSPVR